MSREKTKAKRKDNRVRLNRYIAGAGVASRRGADGLIEAGRVTVNGRPASVGMSIDPHRDHVKVNGKLLRPPGERVHLLLNKPAGYLCSLSDPSKRPLVTDLIGEFRHRRLYPVGRLDFNSEGLLLLTDDGDFAARVGHPSTGPEKTYHVRVRGVPDERTIERLRSGITIGGRRTRPAEARLLRCKKNSWLEVTLKEGRNRQLRRMFQALGHPVVRLRRVKIGPLSAGTLKPGSYRLLRPDEVVRLMSPDTETRRR